MPHAEPAYVAHAEPVYVPHAEPSLLRGTFHELSFDDNTFKTEA